jgi:hypothetical protein
VPETAEKHGDQEVALGLPSWSTIAAERDVQVVAQPRGEADVPVAPEFLRREDQVGESEVLNELDAHQLRGAAGDVRIPREVAVNLKRKGVGASPLER